MKPSKKLFNQIGISLIFTVALIVGFSCASLQPGADPLVVHTEQTLTIGKATFDTVLDVDQADRGFWRTNVPAFHNFCEFLRVPTPINAGTNLARCYAALWNLDMAKLAYKSAKTESNSNLWWEAFSVASTLAGQAGSWAAIVTNRATIVTLSTPTK